MTTPQDVEQPIDTDGVSLDHETRRTSTLLFCSSIILGSSKLQKTDNVLTAISSIQSHVTPYGPSACGTCDCTSVPQDLQQKPGQSYTSPYNTRDVGILDDWVKSLAGETLGRDTNLILDVGSSTNPTSTFEATLHTASQCVDALKTVWREAEPHRTLQLAQALYDLEKVRSELGEVKETLDTYGKGIYAYQLESESLRDENESLRHEMESLRNETE
ncbi:hypothetical protein TREMEDRAFT_65216 [Tremella mesenterica DSM 1558]|uniref:uncharacterized protein n=1 Tax=Tremella mesenterica (strain ATCC 24925 / CBS 8224 / DSM 1558 / NBRC 9311 / NRRL Y-6157 / RJB 2259-6 / UBC 559-6) TaxID=578456 RepID=UPI00032B9CD0|nr:uncharacterized protein TREMEDRAFT_65216 [Tremella mesenterica DSM 1558]EIW66811.1 hypothetical protein TREMEDRAFT_65216 [Tremella mesenterica DSM 1558]